MTKDEFLMAGIHFCNLDQEQLETYFNWEEVEKLPNGAFEELALLKYSQYLSGNVFEVIKELEELCLYDRIRMLEIWTEITTDPDLLRDLLHKVVHNLMK